MMVELLSTYMYVKQNKNLIHFNSLTYGIKSFPWINQQVHLLTSIKQTRSIVMSERALADHDSRYQENNHKKTNKTHFSGGKQP